MTPKNPSQNQLSHSLKTALSIALLIFLVALVYCPPTLLTGRETLSGFDHRELHSHRIRYAQEALFSSTPHLPAWYTKEALGTPFWSNMQAFPWLPNRLLLLFADPDLAYGIGVNLAAMLAAIFTFLFCREIGLSHLPAAAAGWTFACSGYFAARVLVGHLPLLEAYPSLPLLLWLVELAAKRRAQPHQLARLLVALAVVTTFIVLAGHPQLPAYSVALGLLYAIFRLRKESLQVLAAIFLGIGCSLFAWLPMLKLISRSSRALSLDQPSNDVAFPYERLLAFASPWSQGWPPQVNLAPHKDFILSENMAYFWDTVCYVGILPLLALGFVCIYALFLRKKWPLIQDKRLWSLLALMGIVGFLALLTSLPLAQAFSFGSGTILRSPARQLYIVVFILALIFGFALELLALLLANLATRGGATLSCTKVKVLVLLLCTAHFLDLSTHAKPFIQTVSSARLHSDEISKSLGRLGDADRVAFDIIAHLDSNRAVDDIGFFDSITLATTYRAMANLAQMPEGWNSQRFREAFRMPVGALEFLGVSYLISATPSPVLETLYRDAGKTPPQSMGVHVYEIPEPAKRARFYPESEIVYLPDDKVGQILRTGSPHIQDRLVLPKEVQTPKANARLTTPKNAPAALKYARPSSDEIAIDITSTEGGYVRLLESWDPGWQAELDGEPTPTVRANSFLIAVQVPAGKHSIRLTYHTPWSKAGMAISLASVCFLALLASKTWNSCVRQHA